MKQDKYTNASDLSMFGFLANAMSGGWGKDAGQSFPYSDAEDLSRGLRFIPGEVTVARREGKRVAFMQPCNNACCWYWQFPDGGRTYYWDRLAYEQIAQANGKKKNEEGNYPDGAGPCPECGNEHTRGGYVEPAETAD